MDILTLSTQRASFEQDFLLKCGILHNSWLLYQDTLRNVVLLPDIEY